LIEGRIIMPDLFTKCPECKRAGCVADMKAPMGERLKPCPNDVCEVGFIPVEVHSDVETLVSAVLRSKMIDDGVQLIAAFGEAQKPEVPDNVKGLVEEYFREYHTNSVSTLPHSTMLDPIEAADDQKERDWLAAKIAVFCESQRAGDKDEIGQLTEDQTVWNKRC